MVPRRLALPASLLALVLAPPAAAAPFTAGEGRGASVHVTPDGRGHVAWVTKGDPVRIGTCRVAPGASACERTQTLVIPSSGNPNVNGVSVDVFPMGASGVGIVASCFNCAGDGTTDKTLRWTTADGGETWSAAQVIGLPSGGGGGALGGPGEHVAGLGYLGPVLGGAVQRMEAPGASAWVKVFSGIAYSPQVVAVPGSPQVIYAASTLDEVKFGVFTGAERTADALADPTRWEADRTLADATGDEDETALAAGPAGAFLLSEDRTEARGKVLLRQWDPATRTFGARQQVNDHTTAIDNSQYPNVAQDASGRLHVVWRSLHDGGRLRYRRSEAGTSGFGAVLNLAANEVPHDPEVAAGPDGGGFAVWTGIGDSNIRVAALSGATAEPAAPGPGPGGPGPGPGSPGPTGPSPGPGPGTPPPGAGLPIAGSLRPTTTAASAPEGTVALQTPRECVRPGQRYRVTLAFRRKRRKAGSRGGTVVVKVSQVVFSVDGKRIKTDRRAPFRQTLTVDTTARAGGRIEVRARATLKVRRGKSPKRSVRAYVNVCR